MPSSAGTPPLKPGMLSGLRVVECADETAEYCGLLLAGLGAEVIKIEPLGGNATRRIGPFLDDAPHPDRSIYFWAYNRGKKSVVLDAGTGAGSATFLDLLDGADIVLEAGGDLLRQATGLDRAALLTRFPSLVFARMTPFGDHGPWKNYKGSDLVHLAQVAVDR